ncbi:MAG: hypothetical protein WCG10_05405 [Chlamydiota bacterium]
MTTLIQNLESWRTCTRTAYLYVENRDIKFSPVDLASKTAKKLSVGRITELALKTITNQSTFGDLREIEYSLLKIKTSILSKYSLSNFLVKKLYNLRSAFYNSLLGFGFISSASLLDKAIATTQARKAKVQNWQFSPQEKRLFSKIFTTKNIQEIDRWTANRLIEVQGVGIIKPTFYGTNIPVFELNTLFPGKIFKFCTRQYSNGSDRYLESDLTKEVCKKYNLDKLVIPKCATFDVDFSNKNLSILVQEKLPLENKPKIQQEQEIQKIAEQLAVLICKTKFRDVKFDNIPLINTENGICVALIDLEPQTFRQVSIREALIGWDKLPEFGFFGQESPGLMRCFPRHAKTIYETVKTHLSSQEFDSIQPQLQEVLNKADKIKMRHEAIQVHHIQRGITKESPAIPLEVLSQLHLNLNATDLASFQEAISIINATIIKQARDNPDLVSSREYRITRDWDPENNIDRWFGAIKKILPKLKEAGIVHSFCNGDDYMKSDLYVTGINFLREDDVIIQF